MLTTLNDRLIANMRGVCEQNFITQHAGNKVIYQLAVYPWFGKGSNDDWFFTSLVDLCAFEGEVDCHVYFLELILY